MYITDVEIFYRNCPVNCHSILYCTSIAIYRSVQYCIEIFCTVREYNVFYFTIMYGTVQNSTVLTTLWHYGEQSSLQGNHSLITCSHTRASDSRMKAWGSRKKAEEHRKMVGEHHTLVWGLHTLA